MTGRTVGHYKIEDRLGEGGMGVVYRATDLRLKRTVAIKFLSASAVSDPERRKRFEHEARLASSLNHPNIITIFDIGAETLDGHEAPFMAMELVSGKPLDKLIQAGELSIKMAVKYGIQIASGLAAAHAAEIVHRDLKPSNLIVSNDGLVKILDFGLAKWTSPLEVGGYDETRTDALTIEGSIMGSTSYMSPEQAQGKRIDGRSDIFSFGSVLYEMVTKQKAFGGDTKLASLSLILQREPEPVEVCKKEAPAELVRIITRCHRKEPEKRWQSAADLRVALEEVLEDFDSSRVTQVRVVRESQSNRRMFLAAGAGLAAGLIPSAYFALKGRPLAPPVYQRLTFRRGDIYTGRFAPGAAIVYTAAWDGAPRRVYAVQPGNRESRDLGLEAGSALSVAHSGEILFHRGSDLVGMLSRTDTGGGGLKDVQKDVVDADWGPAGASYAFVRSEGGGKFHLEYPAGNTILHTSLRPPVSARVSPDGAFVALFEWDTEIGDYSVVVVEKTGVKRALSHGWRGTGGIVWAAGGSEVWFAGSRAGGEPAVHAVTLRGRERLLTQAPGWIVLLDYAADRGLLVSSTDSRVGITYIRGGVRREMGWHDASLVTDISASGAKLLFVEAGHLEDRNSAIYLRDADAPTAIRLGFGNRPVLSPDEKLVLAIRRGKDGSRLLLLPVGAGDERYLSAEGLRHESAEWFPDSSRILLTAAEGDRPVRSFVRDISGGKPVAVTEEGGRASCVSPDGQSFVINKAMKCYLRKVAGGEAREVAAVTPVRWSPDGRFYYARNAGESRIYKVDAGTGKASPWKDLETPEPGAVLLAQMAISADGSAMACSYQRDVSSMYLVSGLA